MPALEILAERILLNATKDMSQNDGDNTDERNVLWP